MSFKRKRSDSNSSPASSSSLFSRSSVSPSPLSHFNNAMQLDVPTQAHPSPTPWIWQQSTNEASNASGRTQKRVRDNRPDERLIHESTLRRLYSAQREHPNPSPIPSEEPAPPESDSTPAELPAQKSTLHTFWGNISKTSSKPSASSMPTAPGGAGSIRCEDCKASLKSEDSMDMDVDMDVDGSGPQQQYACNHCGRMVCGTCSVSRDVRSCLNCAMV